MAEAIVTHHAIERLRERILPGVSDDDARETILRCLDSVQTVTPSRDGNAVICRTRSPYALRIVVSNQQNAELPQVVTVKHGDHGNSPSDRRHRGKSRAKLLTKLAVDKNMTPLRVIARLPAGFAASDPWSPSLDGILAYWAMRERLGEEAFAMQSARDDEMQPVESLPLQTEVDGELWWYCASSPVYEKAAEFRRYYHRRFDTSEAERYAAGVKKVQTAAGPYKNSRLNHLVKVAGEVEWHVIGDKAEIERLLRRASHIGRGFASGMGRVSEWLVTEEGADARVAALHRPLPAGYAERHGCEGPRMTWGFRPPGRLAINNADCVMPS